MKHAKARAIGLIATGVIAGGVVAGTLTTNAAGSTTSGTSSTSETSPGLTAPGARPGALAHRLGSAPVRSDESALSPSLTSSLTKKAAAKTGGTVYRVESDAGDGKYEAHVKHVKKADGTLVTVKFDSAGNITAVESGMGQGDPAPAGGGQPPTAGTTG